MNELPPRETPVPAIAEPAQTETEKPSSRSGFGREFSRAVKRLFGGSESPRDVLEELIEERDEAAVPLDPDERRLVANILELRNVTIYDVMVPRADVIAIPEDASLADVIEIATKEGHSRLPVYRDTLDDAQGVVHIKDVLGWRGRDEAFKVAEVQRKLIFVSPSMRVLELLLEMRVKRSHMALVVDEFGGVDGLVTIEDLVEEIVGEIEDEHDIDDEPKIELCREGVWEADARVEIEDLEDEIGLFATEDEREDIDTLGGLVFSTAGRVPIRGEIIAHAGGVEFEILDADPRRIHRVRLRRRSAPEPVAAQANE